MLKNLGLQVRCLLSYSSKPYSLNPTVYPTLNASPETLNPNPSHSFRGAREDRSLASTIRHPRWSQGLGVGV